MEFLPEVGGGRPLADDLVDLNGAQQQRRYKVRCGSSLAASGIAQPCRHVDWDPGSVRHIIGILYAAYLRVLYC